MLGFRLHNHIQIFEGLMVPGTRELAQHAFLLQSAPLSADAHLYLEHLSHPLVRGFSLCAKLEFRAKELAPEQLLFRHGSIRWIGGKCACVCMYVCVYVYFKRCVIRPRTSGVLDLKLVQGKRSCQETRYDCLLAPISRRIGSVRVEPRLLLIMLASFLA